MIQLMKGRRDPARARRHAGRLTARLEPRPPPPPPPPGRLFEIAPALLARPLVSTTPRQAGTHLWPILSALGTAGNPGRQHTDGSTRIGSASTRRLGRRPRRIALGLGLPGRARSCRSCDMGPGRETARSRRGEQQLEPASAGLGRCCFVQAWARALGRMELDPTTSSSSSQRQPSTRPRCRPARTHSTQPIGRPTDPCCRTSTPPVPATCRPA